MYKTKKWGVILLALFFSLFDVFLVKVMAPWLKPMQLMAFVTFSKLIFFKLIQTKVPLPKLSERGWDWQKFFKAVGIHLLMIIATVAYQGIMLYFRGSELILENQTALESQLEGSSKLLLFIVLVILVPIFEEILYRGIIINYIGSMEKYSVVISSLIFGLAHIQVASGSTALLQVVPYAIYGLSLALIYYKTKDLKYSIIAHMCQNAFALYVMLGGGF